ncbi:hypothetical protein CIB95_00535 [Lottiidibacillus patelloidae]|uniref:Uncharacterized protein n=1 Tax=Lottiidibacillus patelloidae TaxID=2670334 RepID=A0A263BWJ2_9BACI|nr:hypothetical protein [Lottiidibacillus patelloidae]OZM58099.1 hypothetical protein CIB95_00535 [Lottiidibacillus patelloidae]
MLPFILIISIILIITLLLKIKTFTTTFHWFELLCITIFCVAICSWSFNLYHSAYESLTVKAKYIEFFTTYVHFVIMYPLFLVFVLRAIKKKRSIKIISLYSFSWLIGYLFLLELDIFLGAFIIKHGQLLPLTIVTILNVFSLLTSIFFMKKFGNLLKKEGHING